MTITEVYKKYRDKHNPPVPGVVTTLIDPYGGIYNTYLGAPGYPNMQGMPGCCSAVVMSGFFGSKVPDDFGEFIDDVADAYRATHGLIIAIILQSQMKWGEAFQGKEDWEESKAISRSNYDKGNLMRVFIKSLRPVTLDDVKHSEIKQKRDAEIREAQVKEQKEQVATYQAAVARGERAAYPAYKQAPLPKGYYEDCGCSICQDAKVKDEATQKALAAAQEKIKEKEKVA